MRHGWPRRIAAVASALLWLAGCSTAPTPALPPPVAGLVHPELTRVGQPTLLDGSTSAVAAGRIVRFRIAVADGTTAVDLSSPVTLHTFVVAGTYGVELTVFDDHGHEGSVTSSVRVVEDFAATCDSTGAAGAASVCDGVPCVAGACAVLACGGDPACPAAVAGQATFCNHGHCATTAAELPADAWGGDDLGRLPLDGH